VEQTNIEAFDMVTRGSTVDVSTRGIAVDEQHGFLFATCSEGTVTVIDSHADGKRLSTDARGSGFDVIGYSPGLGHLYLAGSACACLVVMGVSKIGALSYLGRFNATSSTHCATADDRGQAWVCDPDKGRLLRIGDPWPSTLSDH